MMKLCPTCHRDLDEIEQMGVLVDFCPNCHGIWLERGELEKITEYTRRMESADDVSATTPRFIKVYETGTRRSSEDTLTSKNSSFNLLDIFRQR